MTTDELTAGSERRLPRWVPLVAGGLVLLAVGGDRWQLHREQQALLGCVDAAQQEVRYTDRRIAGTTEYVMPALVSARTPPRVRAGLDALLRQEVRRAVPGAEQARRACAGEQVLPWHRSLDRAHDAVDGYLGARTGYLRAGAADRDALRSGAPALDVRRERALTAVLRAEPGEADRVRELLGR
ncbi:MAG: hypothetical protein ACXVGH_01400 [Mycobacteriales bacterium]